MVQAEDDDDDIVAAAAVFNVLTLLTG